MALGGLSVSDRHLYVVARDARQRLPGVAPLAEGLAQARNRDVGFPRVQRWQDGVRVVWRAHWGHVERQFPDGALRVRFDDKPIPSGVSGGFCWRLPRST